MRCDALAILRVAIAAANPAKMVEAALRRRHDLDRYERIFVVGAGKASGTMAQAAEAVLGRRMTAGCVAVKDGDSSKCKRVDLRHCGHPVPDERGVAAADELLVNTAVADLAVSGRQLRGYDKTVVIVAFLSVGRLMTLQAADVLACMDAQLVFVYDRELLVDVALRAPTRRSDESRRGLVRHAARPNPRHRKGSHEKRRANDNGDEHGSERQSMLLRGCASAHNALRRCAGSEAGMLRDFVCLRTSTKRYRAGSW